MRYLIIIATLILFACEKSDQQNDCNGHDHKITYNVTGTADEYSVTIDDSTNQTAQFDVQNGWEYTFKRDYGSTDWLYLSAQAKGEGKKVTSQIKVDCTTWKETTSKGDYVIATVDGSLNNY